MSSHKTTPAPVFPKSLTWLGILILGSALTSLGVPTASATSPGLQTSTIEWSGAELADGVLTGGTPRNFLTGNEGWTQAPFASVGSMGLEWETLFDPARREHYLGSLQTADITPGGASTWFSGGYFFPRPEDTILALNTMDADHNQTTWSVSLQPLDPKIMDKYRFFWAANLVSEYEPLYTTPSPGVIVITDANKQHPTLVLQATSSSGVVTWGGSGIVTAPLVNGEKSPTVYVTSAKEMDARITITLGIVDNDPCSSGEALNFATSAAGVTNTAWPSITSCLGDASWSVLANDEANLEIPLHSDTPALAADETRSMVIDGLPEGVTWARLDDTTAGIQIRLSATAETEPGDYPLQFSSFTTRTGTSTTSQPLSSLGTLTIETAAIVIPEEPEVPEEPVVPDEPEIPGEPDIIEEPSVPEDESPNEPSTPEQPEVIEEGELGSEPDDAPEAPPVDEAKRDDDSPEDHGPDIEEDDNEIPAGDATVDEGTPSDDGDSGPDEIEFEETHPTEDDTPESGLEDNTPIDPEPGDSESPVLNPETDDVTVDEGTPSDSAPREPDTSAEIASDDPVETTSPSASSPSEPSSTSLVVQKEPEPEPEPSATGSPAPSASLEISGDRIVIDDPIDIPLGTTIPTDDVTIEESEPILAPAENAVPEPVAASAWLGLSLAGTLAAGGLIAALRRRRAEPEE
jgi:hypothetical protein